MKIYILSLLLFCSISCQPTNKNKSNNSIATIVDKKDSISIETRKDNLQRINSIDSILSTIPNIDLPYSSTQDKLEQYIKNDEGYYSVDTTKLSELRFFNKLFVLEKYSNDFREFYQVEGRKYYPLFKYKQEGQTIIATLVRYTISDRPGIFLELRSIDSKSIENDYIIVFNIFMFEVLYKYDFKIDKNGVIQVMKVIKEYYNEEEKDFVGEPRIEKWNEIYRLNSSGKFKVIKNSKKQ